MVNYVQKGKVQKCHDNPPVHVSMIQQGVYIHHPKGEVKLMTASHE